MTPASADLLAFRRTQAAGVLARWSLLATAAGGAVMSMFPSRYALAGSIVMLLSAGLYIFLSYRAVQVSREAQDAPERLASGDLAGAEELLTATLRRFSIFPAQRVIQLHQLAAVRHNQGRHKEAIELATAALAFRAPPDLRFSAQLLRLDALLLAGDLPSAHRELLALLSEPLRLVDLARVTALRIRYESTVGATGHLLHDLEPKVRLLSFLPARIAAESLARLALAAQLAGLPDLAGHLCAKALCLIPANLLESQFPALAEHWRSQASSLAL